MNRRQFLQAGTVVSAAGALSGLAQTPPVRNGIPFVRFSCNLYSFNDLLRRRTMSLEETFEFCARLGFDAVDPTGYYFPGYPATPPDEYLYRLKRKAFLLGLEISGTGVRNDFANPDEARRAADVALVRQWIECAARLGAPLVRVFSGSGVPAGHTRDEVTGWVVQALRACADHGRKFGVMVALQNHADFVETSDHVLALLERVDSEWFGLHLDIGSFRKADPYQEIGRVVKHAVTWQIKENVWYGQRAVKTDLPKVLELAFAAGYRGYLPLEILEGDPREKLPKFLDEVRQTARRFQSLKA
jgi:sugar phosphate isomerase/epimerase